MIAHGSPEDIEPHPILQRYFDTETAESVFHVKTFKSTFGAKSFTPNEQSVAVLLSWSFEKLRVSYSRERTISRLSFDKCYLFVLFVVIQSLISCYLLFIQKSQILWCHGIFPAKICWLSNYVLIIDFDLLHKEQFPDYVWTPDGFCFWQ